MSATWETTRRRHGTNSGWTLHKRLGEQPCDACFRAKQAYDARRRSAPKQKIASRHAAKAQQRAYQALARRYPDEYRELYAQLKRDLAPEYGIEDAS